jgi:hypothetical protein
MAPDGVGAIIARRVKNLDQLQQLTPGVMVWLKRGLPMACEDKQLKARLKMLLGDNFFVNNLKHLGVWDDLIQHCVVEAEKMGEDMQQYFKKYDLGNVLGKAYPDVYGKIEKIGKADPPRCVQP